MRYFLTLLVLTFFSCSEPTFTTKDHENIKLDMKSIYQRHKAEFQSLASQVASFKYIRAINFKYGRDGLDGIHVYCDSIDRSAAGEAFTITNLSDAIFQPILKKEGISPEILKDIQNRLEKLHCHGFFTLRQPSNTGIPYVHIELKYNDWNGANFYFYKLFDKKMEPEMVNYFNEEDTTMGDLKGLSGILDSNTVWYLNLD